MRSSLLILQVVLVTILASNAIWANNCDLLKSSSAAASSSAVNSRGGSAAASSAASANSKGGSAAASSASSASSKGGSAAASSAASANSKGGSAAANSAASASSKGSSAVANSAASANSKGGSAAASSVASASSKGGSAAANSAASANSKGGSAAANSAASANSKGGSAAASSAASANSKGGSATASSAASASSKGGSAAANSAASTTSKGGSAAASSASSASSKGGSAAASSAASANSKGGSAAANSAASANSKGGSAAANSAASANSKGGSAAANSAASASSKGSSAVANSAASANSKGGSAAASSVAFASSKGGSAAANSAASANSKGGSAAASNVASASSKGGSAAANSAASTNSKGSSAAASSAASANSKGGSAAANSAASANSKGGSAAASSAASASSKGGSAVANSAASTTSKGGSAAASSAASANSKGGSAAASSASSASSKGGSAAASSAASANSKGGSAAASSAATSNSKGGSTTASSAATANSKGGSATASSAASASSKGGPASGGLKNCCGVNEEWSATGKGPCEQPYCKYFGQTPKCNPDGKAIAGCTCKKGFYRNSKNQCVKPDQCDCQICPALNEEYSSCVSPCGETCATMGKDLICNFLACNEGCDCKSGYFRNSTGTCVLAKDCDCPNNEFLDLCYNNCPPKTCDAIGKQFKCPAQESKNCTPACSCYSWMRRNDEGVCVNVEQCPPKTCTKENEVYSYRWWCFKEQCGSEDEPCPDTYYDVPYEPVCTCKRPDFCRNIDGDCVENTGTNRCPDPNTVYKECAKPTYYQTCVARGKDFGEVTWCEKGCECLPGMYRNTKNKCVPEEECECPINEYFDECNWYRGPESCDDIYTSYTIKYPVDKSTCTPGCICDYGFFRNPDGVCVSVEKCPNYNCTSSEVYNNCAGDYNCEECGDERCGWAIPLARPALAASSGDPGISNLKAQSPLAQRAASENDASNAKNFLASSSRQMGPAPTASRAAMAAPASNANPVEMGAALAQPAKSIMPPYYEYTCTPKCLCKWNEYCRNSDGECIKNEGPASCPKENTQYSECKIQPWQQSCEGRGEEIPKNDYCEKGCECQPGYYRNSTLGCVAPEDCECPPKEYYSCDYECTPKTCDDLFKSYEKCYETIDWTNWKCNNVCWCRYNQFRDCEGNCVDYGKCPCPDPNAEMVECPYRCGGGTCDDPVIKTDCFNYCNWYQRFGCQCKAGFVRRSIDDPTCIPVDECPKC